MSTKYLAVMCSVAAILVGLQPSMATTPITVWNFYSSELNRQCPDKQLIRLDGNDLRGALRSFEAMLPEAIQAQIDNARTIGCSSPPYPHTAMCENSATLEVIYHKGLLSTAVSHVCSSYECNDQSDCKPVRP